MSNNSIAFIIKYFHNFLANSCDEGNCWCVSNGGNTCLKWGFDWDFEAYHVDCREDQCWDRETCRRTDKSEFRERHGETGYWCDDTYFSENKGGYYDFYFDMMLMKARGTIFE